jgi:putative transposase
MYVGGSGSVRRLFYKYKSKYGGMEPSDAKRLRASQDENGKLKKLSAEQMFPSQACFAYPPSSRRNVHGAAI